MTFLRNFGAFWYDFIVGDDWVLAVGVLAALALTAVAARSTFENAAWLLLPLLAAAVLAISLWRAVRSH
jgi:hypothetical protein